MIESYSLKTISLMGVTVVALAGVTPPETVPETTVAFIERTGAFGMMVVFFLFVLYAVYLCIPRIFTYVDASRKEFMEEIKAERAARETSIKDHREMLQGHKHDLIQTMDKQTAIIEKQTEELDRIASLIEQKPCILKRTPHGDYIAP